MVDQAVMLAKLSNYLSTIYFSLNFELLESLEGYDPGSNKVGLIPINVFLFIKITDN